MKNAGIQIKGSQEQCLGLAVGRQVDYRGGQKQTQLPHLNGVCRTFWTSFSFGSINRTMKDFCFVSSCFCFWDRVSYSPGWPRTRYVARTSLELFNFPFLPLKYWDYRNVPPHLPKVLVRCDGWFGQLDTICGLDQVGRPTLNPGDIS